MHVNFLEAAHCHYDEHNAHILIVTLSPDLSAHTATSLAPATTSKWPQAGLRASSWPQGLKMASGPQAGLKLASGPQAGLSGSWWVVSTTLTLAGLDRAPVMWLRVAIWPRLYPSPTNVAYHATACVRVTHY